MSATYECGALLTPVLDKNNIRAGNTLDITAIANRKMHDTRVRILTWRNLLWSPEPKWPKVRTQSYCLSILPGNKLVPIASYHKPLSCLIVLVSVDENEDCFEITSANVYQQHQKIKRNKNEEDLRGFRNAGDLLRLLERPLIWTNISL